MQSQLSVGWIAAYGIAIPEPVIFMAPLIVATLTAFKSPSEVTQVLSFPSGFYFDNFIVAADRMGRSFLNSVAITIPAVIFSVVLGAVGGYPLAFMTAGSSRW